MLKARFLAKGRYHEGRFQDGHLLDEAGEAHNLDQVTWLLPIEPQKVLGLALNYKGHAEELGLAQEEPALFWKPNSSLLPHRGTVLKPKGAQFLHYEVELAVVIGRRTRKIKAQEAMDYVGGYTIANDLVVRDYVTNTFRPPIRAKGWDTFGPLGPFLATPEEIPDPHALRLRAYVNGELRQEGTTRDMILSIPEILEYVSRFMTLEPGDVLLTGTPRGISRVEPGDWMRLEIDGLGALENPVEEEP
jgi:5-oxopent-3-ene-1,2,5-tricarboxylate decarboxylase/2-hydroxyhepta-2,4-diene-1,7-dioate isomerase